MSTSLAAALTYAKRGWRVLPVAGKIPTLKDWPAKATADPDPIRMWWTETPSANVGIATGTQSQLLVLDVDPDRGGDDSLRALEAQYGELPDTIEVLTGGGGHHYYFAHPGVWLGNSAGKLGPGLDIRTDGGQVVAPPSVHPVTGRTYEWEVAHHPDDVLPADVPPWLLALLTTKPDLPTGQPNHSIPAGHRNDALAREAGKLRRIGLSETELLPALVAINRQRCAPPLAEAEVRTIAASIGRYQVRAAPSPSANLEGNLPVLFEEDWPDPAPIRAELLRVEPLPMAIVPGPFRACVKDISDRMQCPPDFVAAAMLVMTSSIIGAGCGIRPKKADDWMVIPNLWGGVVGRPSMMKTPAISEAIKPMDALCMAAKQEFDAVNKKHLAELEAYKAKREAIQVAMRKAAKDGAAAAGTPSMDCLMDDFARLEEPKPAVWRRYLTNDATIEKMAELQAGNSRGLLLFRDELVGLFATWDKDGHEADRAFYLEGWNGDRSHTSDRIGRGTTYVANLCVSLFGGIQPAKLTTYLHAAMRGLNNDGLVQRLQLLVYPDDPPTWTLIDRPVDTEAKRIAFQAVERLATMDFRQYGAFAEEDGKIPFFRFTDDA